MTLRSLDPKVIEDVVARVAREMREALGGVGLPPAAAETPADLPTVLRALRAAPSQPEVLRALLAAATRFGARAALFVLRGDHLEGWEGRGFEGDPAISGALRGLRLAGDQPAVRALLDDQATIHAEVGGAWALPDFGQTVRGEALLIPLLVQDKVAGVLYADPASGDVPFDRRAVETAAVAAGLVVERLVLAKAFGQAPAIRPADVVKSGPHPVEAAAPKPATSNAAAGATPDAPAPAAAPAAPAPAAASRPAVQWPPVEGDAGAEAEDARRYARLLMEEIVLYHADKVEDGRSHRDILARLGDELHQARVMYERRVEPRVRATGEYFEEALLKILAAGDPQVLGEPQTT